MRQCRPKPEPSSFNPEKPIDPAAVKKPPGTLAHINRQPLDDASFPSKPMAHEYDGLDIAAVPTA